MESTYAPHSMDPAFRVTRSPLPPERPPFPRRDAERFYDSDDADDDFYDSQDMPTYNDPAYSVNPRDNPHLMSLPDPAKTRTSPTPPAYPEFEGGDNDRLAYRSHDPSPGHRRDPPAVPGVAKIDAEFDAPDPAIEGALEHHVLDPPVEACAAEFRPVISAADFEALPRFVDPEIARHSGKLVAVEEDKGAIARAAAVKIDARVEAVRTEIIGVNLPDFAVLGAGGFQHFTMIVGKQFRAATVAGNRLFKAVDHSPSRS